ncbi:MAG TPA: hypothetical protein VKU85_16060 [bacterium]|nr:hypothetical protein [bacterium]
MANRKTNGGKVRIRSAEQLRAISSPLALRIVGAMERLRRATVMRIGTEIGVPAGSLYYHVRRMEAAGLLRRVGEEQTVRRARTVYELTGDEVVLEPREWVGSHARELVRTRRRILRFAERSLETGTRRSELRFPVKLIQRHVRLTRSDLRELGRRLEEVAEWVVSRDSPRSRSRCVLTLALGPDPAAAARDRGAGPGRGRS